MSKGTRAEWDGLQAKYRAADEALEDYRIDLRVKYGRDYYIDQFSRKKQHRLKMLENAEQRVYDRIFVWLEKHSPWEWSSGTSAHWICSKLTAGQVLGTEAPMLPPESAGYGSLRRERKAVKRGTEIE